VKPHPPQPLARPAEEAKAKEWMITLKNPKKSPSALGVHLDHSDGRTLLVQWIGPAVNGEVSVFEAWNAGNPSKKVCVGDRIVQVNGKSGKSIPLINTLSTTAHLDVIVVRGSEAPLPPPPPSPARAQVRSGGDARQATGRKAAASRSAGSKALAGAGEEALGKEEETQASVMARGHYETGTWNFPRGLVGKMLLQKPMKPEYEEEAIVEGPCWFRVLREPHVPCRFERKRDAELFTHLNCGEIMEASELRQGWARLSEAELKRRNLLAGEVGWVLIDGTPFGAGKLLEPWPQPPACVLERTSTIRWALEEMIEIPICNEEDVAHVVFENDKAWQLLQERRCQQAA